MIFVILSLSFPYGPHDAEKPEAGDLWFFCNNFLYIFIDNTAKKRIIKREGLFIKKGD